MTTPCSRNAGAAPADRRASTGRGSRHPRREGSGRRRSPPNPHARQPDTGAKGVDHRRWSTGRPTLGDAAPDLRQPAGNFGPLTCRPVDAGPSFRRARAGAGIHACRRVRPAVSRPGCRAGPGSVRRKAQCHACSVRAAKEERELLAPSAGEGVRAAAGLDTRPARDATLAVAGPGGGQLVAKRDRLGRYSVVTAMIRAAVARYSRGTRSPRPPARGPAGTLSRARILPNTVSPNTRRRPGGRRTRAGRESPARHVNPAVEIRARGASPGTGRARPGVTLAT